MVKYLVTILTPILINAQAHLGHTSAEIESYHPGYKFEYGVTDEGTLYSTTRMPLGIFIYYFDSKGYTDFNIQVPYNTKCANQQVSIYNDKYVANGDKSWKAYLENDYIMIITMIWDEGINKFIFKYESN